VGLNFVRNEKAVVNMKIAIDYRWVFPHISGIGRYTSNLVSALAAQDKKNEYILIANKGQKISGFNVITVPYGVYSLKNQLCLPRLLQKMKIDVFHSPNFMIPLRISRSTKVVITIHDMIPWLFPEFTPKAKKTRLQWLFKYIIKRAAARADKIISVSENTAKDIVATLNVPREMVAVIYNGLNSDCFQADINEDIGIRDYILFVGRADPYKNLSGLIRAYNNLVIKHKIDNKLLIVGQEDSRYPEVKELVAELQLQDKIVFYGYASPKELKDLYVNAAVYVLPSFYEGFGLPPLEAMAKGVPVAASNAPALAEVLGDNALLFDPDNIDNIADTIFKIIDNKGLAEELSKKGSLHARKFTTAKMAKETIAVYQSILDT